MLKGRGVFANLSVRENLVMAARPSQHSRGWGHRARVLQTFRAWPNGCTTWAASSPAAKRQMVAIGRALINQPGADHLLDEATEGLAPKIAALITRT